MESMPKWYNMHQDKTVPNLSFKISSLIEIHISKWKEEKQMTGENLL